MSLQGFYTTMGLALAAKINAGTKLTVTRVTAGSGETEESATALANTEQTLTVGKARTKGSTAILPVTLAEVNASASYSLTELGVYADDPDEGEILYQVFRPSEAHTITTGGENVYRFYLSESVGPGGVSVTCSPAGLVTEVDLEVGSGWLDASAIPERSVTVTAEALAAYVDALPRSLGERLTITVTGGTLSSRLTIADFVGPGTLHIKAADGATVSLTAGLFIAESTLAYIQITGLKISGLANNNSDCYARASGPVAMRDCTIKKSSTSGVQGFQIAYGTALLNGCTISGYPVGAIASRSSLLTLENCTGSGNTTGLHAYCGGQVALTGTTPTLLGGSSNVRDGIIYKNGVLA